MLSRDNHINKHYIKVYTHMFSIVEYLQMNKPIDREGDKIVRTPKLPNNELIYFIRDSLRFQIIDLIIKLCINQSETFLVCLV